APHLTLLSLHDALPISAYPAIAIPTAKNVVDTSPEALGPYFSTKWPIKAAESPKNKIARLNVNDTSDNDQPIDSCSGPVNTLHRSEEHTSELQSRFDLV